MKRRYFIRSKDSKSVKVFLYKWLKSNRVMLINSVSLIATTLITSMLGFVYWWVAARRFPAEAVGVSSASISAMTLLGGFSILGLSTLLITEIPRKPDQAESLISTALIIVGGVGICVGILFALLASYISPAFKPLGANIQTILAFAFGVSLTAITLVLDAALIGLLRGGLQLWRNTLFAIIKLVALFVTSLILSKGDGIAIYATWAIGNIFSLAVLLALFVFKKGWPGRKYLPQWSLLQKLGSAALQHHIFNITLQIPTLVLPILVTILLSAKMNAWFYVSWMIAYFLFYIPIALTMVLHAMNSAQPSTLAQKARVTISLAFISSIVGVCLLQFAAKQVLTLFGSSYAEQATWTLRILVLAAFPLIIKNHFVSISRIHDRQKYALALIAPSCVLELGVAALGGHFGGLLGLSIGWVTAVYLEVAFMLPTVYKAIWSKQAYAQSIEIKEQIAPKYICLMDTSPLPIMNQDCMSTQGVWLMDTFSLPIVRSPLPAKEQMNAFPDRNNTLLRPHRANGYSNLKPLRLQPYSVQPQKVTVTTSSTSSQHVKGVSDSSTTEGNEPI